jgi:hypothetical protein
MMVATTDTWIRVPHANSRSSELERLNIHAHYERREQVEVSNLFKKKVEVPNGQSLHIAHISHSNHGVQVDYTQI